MGYCRHLPVWILAAFLALTACAAVEERGALVAFLEQDAEDWPVLVAGKRLALFRPGTLDVVLEYPLPTAAGALAVRDGRLLLGDDDGSVVSLAFAFPQGRDGKAGPVVRERAVVAGTGVPVRFLGWAGQALAVGLADGRLVFPGGERPDQVLAGARAFTVSGSHAVLSSAERTRIVSFLDADAVGEVTNIAACTLDADRLLLVGHDGGISVRDLGGIERRDIDRSLIAAERVFLSPDRSWLAVLGADRQDAQNGLAAFYGLQDGRILIASYPGQRVRAAAFDRVSAHLLLVVGPELRLVAFNDPSQKQLGIFTIGD